MFQWYEIQPCRYLFMNIERPNQIVWVFFFAKLIIIYEQAAMFECQMNEPVHFSESKTNNTTGVVRTGTNFERMTLMD